jgi:hypothetical protein
MKINSKSSRIILTLSINIKFVRSWMEKKKYQVLSIVRDKIL